MNENDFDRAARAWLGDGPTRMSDRALSSALQEIHSTRQRRALWPAWRTNRMTTHAKLIATAAAVLVVGVAGYQFLPGLSGSGGTNATPSSSPVLLARGTFVIRDWGKVEFEATREGSTVTGRLAIGEGRGPGWPITVDLECTRQTEDGLIMIGGHITGRPSNPAASDAGTLAAIVLKRGTPVAAQIWTGSFPDWPATRTGNCATYLDAWLTWNRTHHPEKFWLRDDLRGTVEFGP